MLTIETLDLTAPGPVMGHHSIWLPARGIKIPFQFGGKICKRSRPGEPGYPRDSIVDEVMILRALAAEEMAPPVGDLVFFRNVISDYGGAWTCDPLGAYGYEMEDATRLPPGKFHVDAMRRMPIEGSPGAWSDITVEGRDNVVNGYLVDARRSGQDLLRWMGPRFALPDEREPVAELRARVHRECQFPSGERAEAYQDFWIGGELQRGQRRVVERAQALGFVPRPGESVLDVGCQSGSFLQYAAICTGGAARLVGVELDPRYVDCARALARSCAQNINIRRMDVTADRAAFLAWVKAYFPGGVDHLLLLSLEKHIEIFPLLDAIGARHTYVETNAVAVDDGRGPPPQGAMKLHSEVLARNGRHVGNSRDRNLRRLYRIDR
jgi:SAM-dependent methyltransferase